MDSHTKDGHSKTGAVTWRVPKEMREDTAGDFLDRMYLRTHAIGWAEFMELELEKWPNVPNEVRQQMTKAIHLVRRLYLHSFHLDDALQAETREEVDQWHQWLTSKGIEVVGPTDHGGLIYSIYFRDPNGLRLEITYPTDPDWNRHSAKGQADLAMWNEGKKRALEAGCDVGQAMTELIAERRRKR